MSGPDLGAALMIALLALAVAVIAVTGVAVGLRVRPHWSTWVLSVMVLVLVVVALCAAVAPASTVDGLTCTGSAADRLVGASTPDDPFPQECLEEARVQVLGWLGLVVVIAPIWGVVMARAFRGAGKRAGQRVPVES
ncbi:MULTISPECIES: hypothetical protein [unclassified Isoptericola]|uniref:hypothetical protein n=1 Tax=unclassified Isoptericola TaxID=2623355 RepID=UPI00365DACCB